MNNGGPAFPIQDVDVMHINGMSIRDYFAGQVLPVLITFDTDPKKFIADNARTAYLYADAMIAEKEKEWR